MNHFAQSPQCARGLHSACEYEDCACECHMTERERLRLLDELSMERDPQLTPREMWLELSFPRAWRDVPRGGTLT